MDQIEIGLWAESNNSGKAGMCAWTDNPGERLVARYGSVEAVRASCDFEVVRGTVDELREVARRFHAQNTTFGFRAARSIREEIGYAT